MKTEFSKMLFLSKRSTLLQALLSFFTFLLITTSHFPANAAAPLCRELFSQNDTSHITGFLEHATFGPEFTFTNDLIVTEGFAATKGTTDFPQRKAAHTKAYELLKKKCLIRKDCTVEIGSDKHGGNFRVTYSDGWYFEVGIDMVVLEVQTVKGTYADFIRNKSRLELDLFGTMKEIGLEPHERYGGGHIHVGSEFFHENPKLFRDFFADFANHPQLVAGVFARGDRNSPALAMLKPEQQEGFVLALKNFDKFSEPQLKDFIWQIHSEVYTIPYTPEWGGASYYQAIRLDRMYWKNGSGTFELRGFNPQSSPEQFLLQIELIGARMNYLIKQNERVPYKYENSAPDFSNQGAVNAFYRYVTESGLEWNRFKVLLPSRLQNINPN